MRDKITSLESAIDEAMGLSRALELSMKLDRQANDLEGDVHAGERER